MKIALLATLFAFGGSLTGFALTSAGDTSAPVRAAAPIASGPADEIVVRGTDRDCPKPQRT